MSAFARPLFCNFKTVSNTVYYCLTSLACLQWQWVLSVAIAQICCSCSSVFCCVDAKKSADLISQCCASFDPITKYFLFKFGGLIKQSPHSHSQIKEMYKDFSNRQSALQETLFFFSYIDDTVLVMFLSLCTPCTTQSSGADALNRRDPHFWQSDTIECLQST